MTREEIEDLIKLSGVRTSPVRVLVAKALFDSPRPMSGLELETVLATVDRSSITRTLTLFVSSGLVHTIEDGSGSVKYELCRSSHNHFGENSDLHPHFHCMVCGRTYCLSDQTIPVLPLPAGFQAQSTNLVVKGRCADCAAKRN